MFKERFLRFTGFDRFEWKYIFFLIPGAIFVSLILLAIRVSRSVIHGMSVKPIFSAFVIGFVYGFLYAICSIVLQDTLSGIPLNVLRIILICAVNCFGSVAFMGLRSRIE